MMNDVSSVGQLHQRSPTSQLLQLITGHWISQSIYVVAQLGIADRLVVKSKSAAELAREADSNVDVLYRILRMLSRIGVLAEDDQNRFSLTPIGACLRSGSPGTLQNLSIAMGEELYRAWGHSMHPVKTGESAFKHVFGASPFDYRASRPVAAATFNQAMTEWSNEATAALMHAYDFTQFSTVADIGGGYGMFLVRLLQADPMLTGKLFELPYVATGAQERINSANLGSRCEVISGDMFVDPLPKGIDAYILKNTVESFDDARTETLLRRCRESMDGRSKLLIIGWVIRREAPLAFGDLFDTHLLVALGGRIRTESEYHELFGRTGPRLSRLVTTESAMGESVLECMTD